MKVQKIKNDMEFTFLNGNYQKSTGSAVANKTRGLIEAITSNVVAMNNKPLGFWNVADALKIVHDGNAPAVDLCLWVDSTTLYQLNADATQNDLTIVPAAREVNGIKLSKLITPLGEIYIKEGMYLPAGTALLLDLNVIAPVVQPVPGKGNFFLEPLAKTGAGETFQLFGQIGLDHGPEWYHAKFTGLSTKFEAPKYSKSVYLAGGSLDKE